MKQKLSISDHSRDVVGLKYIYPVISRRAKGLSIGINFNTNNTCNWRCVYCQVPNLKKGVAADMDIQLLAQELRFFLNLVLNGDFFEQFNIPLAQRNIKDIAISGNGEPSSLKVFAQCIELIGEISTEMGVFPASHFVLITNGSLMHQPWVREGIGILNRYQGQVWFKLDSATEHGRKKINNNSQSNKKILENLKISSDLCDTALQTCMMEFLTAKEVEEEEREYLGFLGIIKQQQLKLNKIMLYTIARPSCQAEAKLLHKKSRESMKKFANKVSRMGFEVSISD